MITLDNVTKIYKDNVGLENASIHINRGDFVFLVGPSGAGKSTFIKLLLREIKADSGSIIVDGQEVTKLSNREIPLLRRKIGIVFQDFRLLPKKTVFENVAFAMEILHCTKRQINNRVPQALNLVGISDKSDKYPNELSAGEQQRVAIARAIINKPSLLIADEPTGNLDPITAREIMNLLEKINQTGTTVVMVTHAKDIVDRMQKRVIAIEDGHIVRDEFGTYRFHSQNSDVDTEVDEEDEVASCNCGDGSVFGNESSEMPKSSIFRRRRGNKDKDREKDKFDNKEAQPQIDSEDTAEVVKPKVTTNTVDLTRLAEKTKEEEGRK